MIRLALAGWAAFLVSTLIVAPAFAQTPPRPATMWTIQAVDNHVPGIRREADSANGARRAVQEACGELGGDRAASCLALLGERSFSSLTAAGADWASYYLDVETNALGGRKSYVVVHAVSVPAK